MLRTLTMSFGVMSLMLAGCAPDSTSGGGAKGEGIAAAPRAPVDGRRPDGQAGLEVTAFARDLILNQTASDTLPATTEDKGLIEVNPISFDPAFFR